MAYLTNCKVCGTGTCDTNICGLCAQRIAGIITSGGKYKQKEVKKHVDKFRLDEMNKRLHQQMRKCPHCGK